MNKTFEDYSINIVWISTAASDVLAGINSFHSVLQEITSLFGTGTASGTPQQNTKGSWWRVTRLQACRHGLSLNWDSPACTEARACFLTVSGSSLSASSSNLTQNTSPAGAPDEAVFHGCCYTKTCPPKILSSSLQALKLPLQVQSPLNSWSLSVTALGNTQVWLCRVLRTCGTTLATE